MNSRALHYAQQLRDNAEKVLQTRADSWQSSLLHELHVHQLELQAQNDDLRQCLSELEESRDLYLNLYEQAPVGYLTLDTSGVLQAVNRTGYQLLARPRDKLLGRRFSTWVALAENDLWNQVFSRACRGPEPQTCDLTLLREDGSTWRARLHCVRHGVQLPAVRVGLTDLSASQHIESRLKLAASVFSQVREGIMITDAQGTIVEVNEAFSRITGYAANEALGKNPRLLRSVRTTQAQLLELWQQLTDSLHWQGEIWNRRSNGEHFLSRQSISAILDSDGKLEHYVSLFSDITGQQQVTK